MSNSSPSQPPPNRGLVIIDLQNEFLSPGGRFRIHSDSLPFLGNITQITAPFRVSRYPIFWIRSEYQSDNAHSSNTATLANSQHWDRRNYLAGTHTGSKPCCVRGSFGAEFYPDIQTLVNHPDGENIILTKTWYSAFKETTLLAELRQRGIERLFVCGLLTNVCVNATVVDACSHGFSVTLMEDCLGWRKRASHDRALREMSRLGAHISSVAEILQDGLVDVRLQRPHLYYVNGSIPSWRVMMALHGKKDRFDKTRLFVMSMPKDTRSPEFLKINHRGKAPVLVDVLPSDAGAKNGKPTVSDTVTINESLAIIHYIEAHHNHAVPLLPPASERAAYACALARIQESENLRLIYDSLEDVHFDAEHKGGNLGAEERTRLIGSVDRELDYWETYAEKSTFIASDKFGLADCAFWPILAYMVHRGFDWQRRNDLNDTAVDAWPNLKAYFQSVWEYGGKEGPAQRSQPIGWHKKGKANIWKGTKNGAKGLYKGKLELDASH